MAEDYVNSGMRLAFRRDGHELVAQLETAGKEPIRMGSCMINSLLDEPALRHEFMALMKRVVEVALREAAGVTGAKWDQVGLN